MTLYQPALSDIQDALQTLLQNEGITAAAVSVLLSGANGHAAYASDFAALEAMLPASVPLYYKHLCGEYDTAVSFALWLGQRILETQEIPHDLVQTKTTRPLHVACSYIILYSNYFGRNQSLLLLRREEGAGLG